MVVYGASFQCQRSSDSVTAVYLHSSPQKRDHAGNMLAPMGLAYVDSLEVSPTVYFSELVKCFFWDFEHLDAAVAMSPTRVARAAASACTEY